MSQFKIKHLHILGPPNVDLPPVLYPDLIIQLKSLTLKIIKGEEETTETHGSQLVEVLLAFPLLLTINIRGTQNVQVFDYELRQ